MFCAHKTIGHKTANFAIKERLKPWRLSLVFGLQIFHAYQVKLKLGGGFASPDPGGPSCLACSIESPVPVLPDDA